MDSINQLREQLDQIDRQIASLLDERMFTIDELGKVKQQLQLNLVDEKREERVLRHVKNAVTHSFLKESIKPIYDLIMLQSKKAQVWMRHLHCPFRKIGVIGLGLMGGSICKGIKMKDPSVRISILKHASQDHTLALANGWIDCAYDTIEELTRDVDLVILASPIHTIIPFAEKLHELTSMSDKKLLVIDIASVKGMITNSFELLTNERVECISTHPMAGKESSGNKHSEGTLFINTKWIIVPHKNNTSSSLHLIEQWIEFFGATAIYLKKEEHDHQVAMISHLPQILSKVFLQFVQERGSDSLGIAGPGFSSFTRLAHENPTLMKDIKVMNKIVINNYLEDWIHYLKQHEGDIT